VNRTFTAALAVTALVAALSSIASADPAAPAATPSVTAVVARVTNDVYDQSKVSLSRVVLPSVDTSWIDRSFHHDYSNALTCDQMSAAWKAEIDLVFETPITGGG
jgi:hypothetical protein